MGPIKRQAFELVASGAEGQLVKTLHSIEAISASIASADGRRVRLVRAEDSLATSCDPRTAMLEALAAPLDFPPFSSATVPGDRVAIAVDDGLPCAGPIVRAAVDVLEKAGVDYADIAIVTAEAAANELIQTAFAGSGASKPQFSVHDPDDDDCLCLMGATKRGEPLLINRSIFDADVVLPISCARLGGRGVFECLYPRLSDRAAMERYQAPSGPGSTLSTEEGLRETNEAGWLVGVPMVVEVVPGAGDSVAKIVAGEPMAVARRSEQLCRQRWLFYSPQPVNLVIATISGAAHAQCWENVGRALAAAEQLLVEGGAVAICSNLDQAPGRSLGRLIGSTDLERVERQVFNDHAADSRTAWHLVRALQRGPVYLLSQLDDEVVDDMGLAPVANVQEIVRLAHRYESCAVVEDSQHAIVTVAASGHDAC